MAQDVKGKSIKERQMIKINKTVYHQVKQLQPVLGDIVHTSDGFIAGGVVNLA